jgi:sigma-B regulation protein RsbU (phosphoserine phosphatase)
MEKHIAAQYEQLLNHYLVKKQESYLYEAQKLSMKMMEQGISPEELVSLHLQVMKKNCPQLNPKVADSLDFLLEVMIGYGLQYKEHQILLENQLQFTSELEIAAGMQQTLLPDVPTQILGLDLGVISVAAKKMSGDYYHFFQDPNGMLGVAIADIIGKGLPAAMCMSMIKYAIESLPEQWLEPHALLGSINRVIEKNIDANMFVTMLYGSYHLQKHLFYYATAGHEPGLYYSAVQDSFSDLQHKGVVLGLSSDSTYTVFEKSLEPQDMIILFTDGVTETKRDGHFLEREELCQLIRRHKELDAQEAVEAIHHELLAWSEFKLNDDQTIIIIKRSV